MKSNPIYNFCYLCSKSTFEKDEFIECSEYRSRLPEKKCDKFSKVHKKLEELNIDVLNHLKEIAVEESIKKIAYNPKKNNSITSYPLILMRSKWFVWKSYLQIAFPLALGLYLTILSNSIHQLILDIMFFVISAGLILFFIKTGLLEREVMKIENYEFTPNLKQLTNTYSFKTPFVYITYIDKKSKQSRLLIYGYEMIDINISNLNFTVEEINGILSGKLNQ